MNMEAKMKNNKIAAIVVTYNRKELLEECIAALENQTKKELDILIVDNASTDGTAEVVQKIAQTQENIVYLNTGSNLGGAGGFHFGLKEAYKRGYEYMWIMDDDTIPYDTALEEFINAHIRLKVRYCYLSSCALWTDGSYCIMNKQLIDQDSCVKEYDKLEDGLIRISKATFVSLFLQRKVVKHMGLPIKEYFIWGDDMEYTLRISRK